MCNRDNGLNLRKWKGNVVFMNKDGEDPTMKGELSDVHVWNRVLKDEEVDAFNQCESLEGNVVSWSHASLNIINLDQSEVDKSQVCHRPPERYRSFLDEENYSDSQTFCYKIGGEVAEARDEETLDQMVSAFTALQVGSEPGRAEYFYSGYSDQQEEGTWEGAVSGQILAWDNWALGYPKDTSQRNDCAQASSLYEWKFLDHICSSKLRPICEFTNEYQRFKLFGVPEQDQTDLDVYYFLNNSTFLEGYLRGILRNILIKINHI